jgi:hypothetical protein
MLTLCQVYERIFYQDSRQKILNFLSAALRRGIIDSVMV